MKKHFSVAMATIILFSIFSICTRVNAGYSTVGAGRVNTTSGSLNVRSAPTADATVKARLSKGSYVTLLSQNGSFWYVQYSENSYGYCHKSYIYQVSSAVRYVATSQGNLRVRTSPSTTASIQDYLPKNTAVTVIKVTNNFAQIIYYGGKTGYVSTAYLTTTTPSTTYKAISLNVPDYKQSDSRWANVTLGNSGQSIARIGCATTALAMTESHRTGTTIYPHQMAKKLSYTQGGAVYWPTNYNISTSANYLATIYNALTQGKPVIVGAKKSNGGQHYVVVTGVKNTNKLTASDFYINDPGSNTRVTLDQFFSVYPYFYKILWVK